MPREGVLGTGALRRKSGETRQPPGTPGSRRDHSRVSRGQHCEDQSQVTLCGGAARGTPTSPSDASQMWVQLLPLGAKIIPY